MKTKYRQCQLRRTCNSVTVETHSFIPEEFAKAGRILKLKDNDVWVDGWIVIVAGGLTDSPPDFHKSIRGHRNNTGDNLPKVT